MPANLEWLFQEIFAQTDVYARTPEDTEWHYVGQADAQPQQGEESYSHREGGSYIYRLYLASDAPFPDGPSVLVRLNGETFRVLARPRVNQDAPNVQACMIVDVERWEG